ncbi:hypothetical protein N801_17130 [Knoellia aerolata DSM 18566]|uniref:Uncharacterized protein n=1 Tax=Knoellia aerolata DSM 18566 TaxID=1385519 RepID=A0A0A0K062_9MICO|nr:hypothetical protein [Knoellia aerolata]KGN42384.1 hypothetical protein N801_17130 [Knoellia aerolata DSM 18566]
MDEDAFRQPKHADLVINASLDSARSDTDEDMSVLRGLLEPVETAENVIPRSDDCRSVGVGRVVIDVAKEPPVVAIFNARVNDVTDLTSKTAATDYHY